MDLMRKIRAAFKGSLSLKKARVVKVKPLGDRVLVYVVSPLFAGKTPLQKQRLVSKAMRETGALTSADLRRVGLVRTLTPATFQKIVKARKARLNGAANKAKKSKEG